MIVKSPFGPSFSLKTLTFSHSRALGAAQRLAGKPLFSQSGGVMRSSRKLRMDQEEAYMEQKAPPLVDDYIFSALIEPEEEDHRIDEEEE